MKLSIIIPVYNNYKLLKKCLDSISKQSFKDLEIIIVDDGSDHLSTEILKQNFIKLNMVERQKLEILVFQNQVENIYFFVMLM